MSKKILFVYPVMGQRRTINHGIASLSAVLKARGFETELLYLEHTKYSEYESYIKSCDPLFVAISTTYNHWRIISDFADSLKRVSAIPVFVGGPHAILFPEALEHAGAIDGVCIGEGEVPILEIAQCLSTGKAVYGVQGMWFRKKNDIIKNEALSLIADLDTLPFPDYELFPDEAVKEYPALLFSRGCPFDCAYCCNNRYREIFKGKGENIRFKSVTRALKEIDRFLKRYSVPFLCFDDDTFIKSPEWRSEFLKQYSKEIHHPFNCNARPELITDAVCAQLKDAGCFIVGIGLEAGDEHIRRTVLGRNISDEMIVRACDRVHAAGMCVSTFNMVGIPGETLSLHEKTVALNQRIRPEYCQISIYYPYPGTALGDYCFAQGIVKKHGESGSFFEGSILDLTDFSSEDIRMSAKLFKWKIFYPYDLMQAFESVTTTDMIERIAALHPEWDPGIQRVWTFLCAKEMEHIDDTLAAIRWHDLDAVQRSIIGLLVKKYIEQGARSALSTVYALASRIKKEGALAQAQELFMVIRNVLKTEEKQILAGASFHLSQIVDRIGNQYERQTFLAETLRHNPDHQAAAESMKRTS